MDNILENVEMLRLLGDAGLDKYFSEMILTPGTRAYEMVNSENKIYFNAHRAFTREYILSLFSPLKLIEEKYIYKNELADNYDKTKGFGTGLFHFKK